MAALLTVRAIRTVAVEVPMARPLGTSAQTMRTAPMLLIDLETEEGITGHAYLFCYTRMVPGLIAAVLAVRTPLQIEQHLTLALETGYQASEKPVGEAIVDSVLSKQIDDLEPTLTRHGYTAKVLTEMLGTKPGEIKALFKQMLGIDRARELKEQMLAAGLPV
jgi:hypothetical protein